MLRIVALALLLSPGVAHAQLFLDADGNDTTAANTGNAPETTETTETAAEGDPVADLTTAGADTVFDGATVEEIEALLTDASSNAIAADEANAIVARVGTDDEGQSVLLLDVASNDASSSTAPTGEEEAANLELGECNEGTDWISDDINCHNAYPTGD